MKWQDKAKGNSFLTYGTVGTTCILEVMIH